MIDIEYCASSYCALRYVVRPDIGWSENFMPELPAKDTGPLTPIRTTEDIIEHLTSVCSTVTDERSCGLLLSGGIDSAILAALLPPSTPTFTIRFDAEGAIDESASAREFAERLGLSNTVVTVGWSNYNAVVDQLMVEKKSPLHPVEAALYHAARAAQRVGVDTLVTGNGADSTFGGLDRLLAHDWKFDAFVERYRFLDPRNVLRTPHDMVEAFEPYRAGGDFDVVRFLKEVHGTGIVQMFENALHCAGCDVVSPYEDLTLDVPLDLERIRKGEPKYLLQEAYRRLFPGFGVPEKIAFARPVGPWLRDWPGPANEIFRKDLDARALTGEQRWIVYCLDRFLALL